MNNNKMTYEQMVEVLRETPDSTYKCGVLLDVKEVIDILKNRYSVENLLFRVGFMFNFNGRVISTFIEVTKDPSKLLGVDIRIVNDTKF